MTTFQCRVCPRHFTPTIPRLYPDAPACYCDECAWLDEETRPPDPLQVKIRDLRINGSLFFPVTESDPRPWETLRAEIKRPRWASTELCVHRVLKGDLYINDRNVTDFEPDDGARLFKLLTREDLSLGVEFVRQLIA